MVITWKQRRSDDRTDSVTGLKCQSFGVSNIVKTSYKIPRLVSPIITIFVRRGICRLPKKTVGNVDSSRETAVAQAGVRKQVPVSWNTPGSFGAVQTSLEVDHIYNTVWAPACTREFQVPSFCRRFARDDIIDDVD